MPLKIFFDGGCRPNPGAIEIAIVVAGRTTIRRDLGHGTSMDAEWLALIHAATLAQTLDATEIVLLGDAINVIAQANGTARPRGAAAHLEAFRALTAKRRPRIRYVKRTQNLAGIALNRLHDR